MYRIPLRFYEIYSNVFIDSFLVIQKEILEIDNILPNHFIKKQFEEVFYEMINCSEPIFDEETLDEYCMNILEFSSFLKKFKQLENEINLFLQKKKVRRRIRNYYYNLFLKKREIIFSNTYQSVIDLTLNSLLGKEMDQEIFYLRQQNYSSKKLQPTLPILIEN